MPASASTLLQNHHASDPRRFTRNPHRAVCRARGALRAAATLLCVAALSACSSSSPPTQAMPKTASVAGQRVTFGGTFRYDNDDVVITANGEQIMKYEFPPFTATAKMHGSYRNVPLMADCYFASILAKKNGPVGMIGRRVQGNANKTTDTCRIYQNEKLIETIEFPITPQP